MVGSIEFGSIFGRKTWIEFTFDVKILSVGIDLGTPGRWIASASKRLQTSASYVHDWDHGFDPVDAMMNVGRRVADKVCHHDKFQQDLLIKQGKKKEKLERITLDDLS